MRLFALIKAIVLLCLASLVIGTPTEVPTNVPSMQPTNAPFAGPTRSPTKAPTDAPFADPTSAPTKAPTRQPTDVPSKQPTDAPTQLPTKAPTDAPTQAPAKQPTNVPTKRPTKAPTDAPTDAPTQEPTNAPFAPTSTPTNPPTIAPTFSPTLPLSNWCPHGKVALDPEVVLISSPYDWPHAPALLAVRDGQPALLACSNVNATYALMLWHLPDDMLGLSWSGNNTVVIDSTWQCPVGEYQSSPISFGDSSLLVPYYNNDDGLHVKLALSTDGVGLSWEYQDVYECAGDPNVTPMHIEGNVVLTNAGERPAIVFVCQNSLYYLLANDTDGLIWPSSPVLVNAVSGSPVSLLTASSDRLIVLYFDAGKGARALLMGQLSLDDGFSWLSPTLVFATDYSVIHRKYVSTLPLVTGDVFVALAFGGSPKNTYVVRFLELTANFTDPQFFNVLTGEFVKETLLISGISGLVRNDGLPILVNNFWNAGPDVMLNKGNEDGTSFDTFWYPSGGGYPSYGSSLLGFASSIRISKLIYDDVGIVSDTNGDGYFFLRVNCFGLPSLSPTHQPSLAPSNAPSLSPTAVVHCGNNQVDEGEQCDGGECCTIECVYANVSVVCAPPLGACDRPEYCSGLSSTCSSTPLDNVLPIGVVCRESAGVCDSEEVCDGSSADCPDDTFRGSDSLCREVMVGSLCDLPEYCLGNNTECPEDSVREFGSVCRRAAGECDVVEVCDGSTKLCGPDLRETREKQCRAAGTHLCASAEYCEGNGGSVHCPVDRNATVNTVCDDGDPCTGYGDGTDRCTSSGVCAAPYSCMCHEDSNCDDSNVCSIDRCIDGTCTYAPAGTDLGGVCRAAAGPCDRTEFCAADSIECPVDTFLSDSTVCRDLAGVCDVEEYCDGTSAQCSDDKFMDASAVCSGQPPTLTDHRTCALPRLCSGNTAECIEADRVKVSGTVCAYAPSEARGCVRDSVCDGTEAVCAGVGAWVPNGATCDDGVSCTVADQCLKGRCRGTLSCNCADDFQCNDQNSCTTDVCSTAGQCEATFWTLDAPEVVCDDLNACTVNDTCDGDGGCSGVLTAPGVDDCPEKCGDHGRCCADKCICDVGWAGRSCTIAVGDEEYIDWCGEAPCIVYSIFDTANIPINVPTGNFTVQQVTAVFTAIGGSFFKFASRYGIDGTTGVDASTLIDNGEALLVTFARNVSVRGLRLSWMHANARARVRVASNVPPSMSYDNLDLAALGFVGDTVDVVGSSEAASASTIIDRRHRPGTFVGRSVLIEHVSGRGFTFAELAIDEPDWNDNFLPSDADEEEVPVPVHSPGGDGACGKNGLACLFIGIASAVCVCIAVICSILYAIWRRRARKRRDVQGTELTEKSMAGLQLYDDLTLLPTLPSSLPASPKGHNAKTFAYKETSLVAGPEDDAETFAYHETSLVQKGDAETFAYHETSLVQKGDAETFAYHDTSLVQNDNAQESAYERLEMIRKSDHTYTLAPFGKDALLSDDGNSSKPSLAYGDSSLLQESDTLHADSGLSAPTGGSAAAERSTLEVPLSPKSKDAAQTRRFRRRSQRRSVRLHGKGTLPPDPGNRLSRQLRMATAEAWSPSSITDDVRETPTNAIVDTNGDELLLVEGSENVRVRGEHPTVQTGEVIGQRYDALGGRDVKATKWRGENNTIEPLPAMEDANDVALDIAVRSANSDDVHAQRSETLQEAVIARRVRLMKEKEDKRGK